MFYRRKNRCYKNQTTFKLGREKCIFIDTFYVLCQLDSDLIILDDPISSFDTNKKYAILQRMFKNVGNKNVTFAGKTVLLLTHDFEPITDFIVVGKLDESKSGCFIYL